jgi:hypothetical protein
MQYVEDEEDIGNVEAWTEILEDLLYLMPFDSRMKVLQLVVANHEADVAERVKHGPLGKRISMDPEKFRNEPGLRHWNAIMRLKSLIIQVFARDISNNHSPKDAGRLLFTQHRYGTGSGCLDEYIDKLPRP